METRTITTKTFVSVYIHKQYTSFNYYGTLNSLNFPACYPTRDPLPPHTQQPPFRTKSKTVFTSHRGFKNMLSTDSYPLFSLQQKEETSRTIFHKLCSLCMLNTAPISKDENSVSPK